MRRASLSTVPTSLARCLQGSSGEGCRQLKSVRPGSPGRYPAMEGVLASARSPRPQTKVAARMMVAVRPEINEGTFSEGGASRLRFHDVPFGMFHHLRQPGNELAFDPSHEPYCYPPGLPWYRLTCSPASSKHLERTVLPLPRPDTPDVGGHGRDGGAAPIPARSTYRSDLISHPRKALCPPGHVASDAASGTGDGPFPIRSPPDIVTEYFPVVHPVSSPRDDVSVPPEPPDGWQRSPRHCSVTLSSHRVRYSKRWTGRRGTAFIYATGKQAACL